MSKSYPPRERFDDGHYIEWDDVCECGHSWSDHIVSVLALFSNRHSVKQCERCQCPKYKRDKNNISERRKYFTKVTEGSP